ncbi:MAG: TlpA family protein disulfide reductase [Phycisphaerales bacterium]
MRLLIAGLLAFGLSIATVSCDQQESVLAGSAEAPDFTLDLADGSTFTLSEARGDVVLLDFWATWCPPCRAAMPGIQSIHEKYASRGVRVLGVNINDDTAKARAYMSDNGFDYGLLVEGDSVAEKYKVTGIPTFFLIGVDGEVVLHHVGGGESAADIIEPALDSYLRKIGR